MKIFKKITILKKIIILITLFTTAYILTESIGKNDIEHGILKNYTLTPFGKGAYFNLPNPNLITIFPFVIADRKHDCTKVYLWIPLDISNHYITIY